MNDIERRALIGAAGIGAIAALSKAGPLNPPAGAVASSGRTLDEVYNKIATPPAIGGYDGRTPIPGGTAAFTISQPGSYVLTGNLTVSSSTALIINASNVTVDLNGFTVTCNSIIFYPFLANGIRNVRLRNGRLVGGQACVAFIGGCVNCIVEDVQCTDSYAYGIYFNNSATDRGNTVRRCSVSDIGSLTTASTGNLTLVGIYFSGNAGRIEDCTVTRLLYNGGGTPTYRGIYLPATGAATGNCVSNCTISQDAASTGTGLLIVGTGLYRNNEVLHFATAYNTGGSANGGGNFSV